jgi:3-hydroxybutyryl-CoA dehydratase
MQEAVLDYDALQAGQTFPAVPCSLTDTFVDAYLQATGEVHPLFDVVGHGGGYAPPFCTSLVGFIKGSLGGRWPDGTMHLSQGMQLLRPLHRGEELMLDVHIGQKYIRNGRRYLELIATTRDRDEQAVVRGNMLMLWAGATEAGRPSTSPRQAGSEHPPTPTGRPLDPVTADFPLSRLEAYGRVAKAQDPIHLDPEYARQTRFGRNIAQGLLVLTLLSRLMIQACGARWLASGALHIRFAKPVFVGERITARGVVVDESKHTYVVWCENAEGTRVISGQTSIGP